MTLIQRFAVLTAVGAVAFAMLANPSTSAGASTAALSTTRAPMRVGHGTPTPAAAEVARHLIARDCASPGRGRMACQAIRQLDTVEPGVFKRAAITAAATPAGYGPSQLRSAYKLTATGSSAQIVAVVDAYNDPSAAADLAVYRSQYGLAACTVASGCFTQANQNGAMSPLPAADQGWAGEISLDLDMVSAICPGCRILLVEAASSSDADLYAAEDRAVAMGAKFVSNSWGGSEYSGQTADDVHFNHPGVAITASTGDSGSGASYPATSRYVTAVGGTTLTPAAGPRGWAESAWSGAGSGCSAYEPKPAFQSGVSSNCTKRAEADVSAVADPDTGVAVYQTYGNSGWAVYGGTSAASPIIASTYALAGNPGASDDPNSYPYAHAAGLYDVASGSNGSCGAPICTSGSGWDGPTGLGSPNGTAGFTAGPSSAPPAPIVALCRVVQLLANPGFESGATGWTASPGVIGTYGGSGEPTHSGSGDAWLDGYGTTHTDILSQTVTIPAACAKSTVSFYLHVDTAEKPTAQFDRLTVKAAGSTLGTFSNLDAHSGYLVHTFSLAAFAGRTVSLTFTGVEDRTLLTSFVLDDLSVTTG